MPNSNPNWTFGYVPSALTWNNSYAIKVDGANGQAFALNLQQPTVADWLFLSVQSQAPSSGNAIWFDGNILHTPPLPPLPNYLGAPVSVATTTGTTLTAADVASGAILRSGPTAAFTDTFDTAANIIAALPGVELNQGILLVVTNLTNYLQTLAAGTGVTLVSTTQQSNITQAVNATIWRLVVTNITAGSEAVQFTRIGSMGT